MDEITLSDAERTELSGCLLDLNLDSPYEDFETFLLETSPVPSALPREVQRRVRSFRNDPHAYGALLLRNLPIDDHLPPTPVDGRPSRDKKTFVSEACVLGVSQILGEPIGYHDEKEGEILQALCPVQSEASATSSESSDIELGFHTDFNFDKEHPERPYNVVNPDYIALLCLRADRNREAWTSYADARDICRNLDAAQLDVARAPLFQFAASYSFTGACGADRTWSVPSPLIQGPDALPEVSIDLLCGVRALSEEANGVLDAIREVCGRPDVATSACLGPGDLLFIDNRKGAHARTAFTAYFDGQDRWLHRVYLRRSLWELRSGSNRELRVF